MKNNNIKTRIDAGPMTGTDAAVGFVHDLVQVPGIPRLGFLDADRSPTVALSTRNRTAS